MSWLTRGQGAGGSRPAGVKRRPYSNPHLRASLGTFGPTAATPPPGPPRGGSAALGGDREKPGTERRAVRRARAPPAPSEPGAEDTVSGAEGSDRLGGPRAASRGFPYVLMGSTGSVRPRATKPPLALAPGRGAGGLRRRPGGVLCCREWRSGPVLFSWGRLGGLGLRGGRIAFSSPPPYRFADREREEEEEEKGGGRLPGGPRLRGVAPGRAVTHCACAVENFSPCPTVAALGRRAGPRAGRAGSRGSGGSGSRGRGAARGGSADCSSQSAARQEAAPGLGGNGGGGTGAAGPEGAARGVGRRGPGAFGSPAFLCLSLCEYVLEGARGVPGSGFSPC